MKKEAKVDRAFCRKSARRRHEAVTAVIDATEPVNLIMTKMRAAPREQSLGMALKNQAVDPKPFSVKINAF